MAWTANYSMYTCTLQRTLHTDQQYRKLFHDEYDEYQSVISKAKSQKLDMAPSPKRGGSRSHLLMKRTSELKMHHQTLVSNVLMENLGWRFWCNRRGWADNDLAHIWCAGWRTIAGFAQGVQNQWQCKIWWLAGSDFAATRFCITCISNHPRVTHFCHSHS